MKFEFLTADYEDCPPDKAPTRFGFTCPKGKMGGADGMCSGLIIRGNPDGLAPPNATWEWNGNRDKPTFRPSINCAQCSHGWITDGVWKDA